ncbi:hypothetical protein QEN19_002167 [Hanseniaspora menglaensis]
MSNTGKTAQPTQPAKTINDSDVIQSIYANKKEKFDILSVEPNIKDREKEIEYFNNLKKNEKEENGKVISNDAISYYDTISTISKLGISQNVVFSNQELRTMCDSKFGGGVIPVNSEDDSNAFISNISYDFNDEIDKSFIQEYNLNTSFHSWLQNSKNKKVPELLSHLLLKENNINVETLMMIGEDQLKVWSELVNLEFTKQDTAELVDAFILYKKYVHLFK